MPARVHHRIVTSLETYLAADHRILLLTPAGRDLRLLAVGCRQVARQLVDGGFLRNAEFGVHTLEGVPRFTYGNDLQLALRSLGAYGFLLGL
jgi:hypothetical protein